MNLMDIITKDWHKSACAIAGEGVEGLLGPSPVPAHTVVGPVRSLKLVSPLQTPRVALTVPTSWRPRPLTPTAVPACTTCCPVQISPYFVGEYGFPESCKAVAWSGDNPCAVAGMRLENAGDACISLGTSDTIFALLDEPSPKTEGHIFGSPVDPAGYMALICFLNGSLVRERVREKVGAADWGAFGEILKETSAGNGGSIALHYDDPEITPHVPKAVEAFYNGDDESVDSLPPAEEARAVIEARFISMRVHAEFIGLKMDRIYATGGASQNNDITQVIADVFGCDVYTMASPGGAPLGAAYRALHALKCEEMGEYVSLGPHCFKLSLRLPGWFYCLHALVFPFSDSGGHTRCRTARHCAMPRLKMQSHTSALLRHRMQIGTLLTLQWCQDLLSWNRRLLRHANRLPGLEGRKNDCVNTLHWNTMCGMFQLPTDADSISTMHRTQTKANAIFPDTNSQPRSAAASARPATGESSGAELSPVWCDRRSRSISCAVRHGSDRKLRSLHTCAWATILPMSFQ